eukprot:TRINITY_DN1669_c0_g3_i3.p1 TRINITY_DN1669_c0_g3~~TRINITY_DN1669_c0_g3_i3.p1  ORF type:complete len:624 (+),score=113.98 TRINITY_DN1669_c0_g3_i3:208-2079(+)
MVEVDSSNYFKISELKGEKSFEVVKSRFSNGLEITKCIYEFFLQLAGLEESFAHGLQKLLRSAAYTLHTNTLMQWLGQDPFEETGTLKEAWKLIGECLSLTAKHHLEKAYLLKQTVAEPLTETKQQLDEIKRQNLKENKYISIRKLVHQIKTEKSKLDAIDTECNKLRGQLDTARVDSFSCKNTLKLEEQIFTIEGQLRDQEQLCGKLEQEHIAAERGNDLQLEYVFNTIHESEWIRISKIRTSLIEFSKVYSNTGPVYLQYCQKLAFRMHDIDADRDIHEFVSTHDYLRHSQNTGFDHMEDVDISRSVAKTYSSYSHPLSHSHKNDNSQKKEVTQVTPVDKEAIFPVPKLKTSKSNKTLTDFEQAQAESVVSPKEPANLVTTPTITKPPNSIKRSEPKIIPPTKQPPPAPPLSGISHTTVPNKLTNPVTSDISRTVEDRKVRRGSEAVVPKIQTPTTEPTPILPILHKDNLDSNINEIVVMHETLIKMSEANDYYRIISGSHDDDIEHLEELRRSITKKLHPDRFAGQPDIQRKANSKLGYLNTIFTDVLLKEEIRKIYNILCQYRKAYSQITSQDIDSLKVAMEKFQKIYRFFKKNEVPPQLIQEVETALKLLNACMKRVK